GMHIIRRWRSGHEAEHGAWFAPTIGVLAGFTTLVANAAGPLMAVYMLAMRLPKMDFVGTGAVFFLILNFFKVPFMVHLGLINTESFAINLWLAPLVLGGAWLGRKLVLKINQPAFENIALALSVVAGLNLLIQAWHG
ncbi:MAG: sulfite exporter TauE/SafE family protein, partial [Opitutaceae bacterium]